MTDRGGARLTSVRVWRMPDGVIRMTFECPERNGAVDFHHWDLSADLARELARALVAEAGEPCRE